MQTKDNKAFNIRINTIQKVKDFCTICMQQSFDIDLTYGRYVIDAKSIMGIFSLDLTKDLGLVIHCNDEELNTFLSLIDKYLIKEIE